MLAVAAMVSEKPLILLGTFKNVSGIIRNDSLRFAMFLGEKSRLAGFWGLARKKGLVGRMAECASSV